MVVKSPPQSRYRANPHQKVSSCPFVSQVVTLLLLIIAAIIEPVCAIHSVKTFRCIASHFTLGYTFIDEETDTHWVQLLAQHHETSQFAAHPGLSQSRGYMLNHYASLRRGRIHSNVSFLAFFFFWWMEGAAYVVCVQINENWIWVQKGIGSQDVLKTKEFFFDFVMRESGNHGVCS